MDGDGAVSDPQNHRVVPKKLWSDFDRLFGTISVRTPVFDSQNVFNSPTKSSTKCLLLLIEILRFLFCGELTF